MNIYTLIKWYRKLDSPRLKLLGILGMHVLGRRYLYIAMDPTQVCNLRCRLCYFSDPDTARAMKGTFSPSDIDAIAKAVFHRGLKLQLGCGSEPTAYKRLPELVKKAKECGIPHVSVTTNGSLLTKEKLSELIDAGLNELVISAHGMTKATYERMMRGASFEHFTALMGEMARVKHDYPHFQVRLNYTICQDNIDDLRQLPATVGVASFDVIQLRPVQDIGSTDYDQYSMDAIFSKYEECVRPVVDYCHEQGILCLYPQTEHLQVLEAENSRKQHLNSVIDMLPFFHLSPYEGWQQEFDPYTETFETYAKRTSRVRMMLRLLWGRGVERVREDEVTKSLNYHVK